MPRADRPLPEYGPDFESPWLKWAQALKHAQELDELVGLWRGSHSPAQSFRAEYQPQRHGFAITAHDIEPVPYRARLLLGDVANNYRAALDHLAWALVSRGKTPPSMLTDRQAGGVCFPILKGREEFNAQVRVPSTPKTRLMLPGIRRADSALVRRAQPFRLSPRRQRIHPLVLLQGINNGDKHRAVQPLWTVPERYHFNITEMTECELSAQIWKRHAEPLTEGGEVALLPARRTGDTPAIQLSVDLSAMPSIGERITSQEWHVRAGILIFQLLREFSAQPPNMVVDVGGKWARFDYDWQPGR